MGREQRTKTGSILAGGSGDEEDESGAEGEASLVGEEEDESGTGSKRRSPAVEECEGEGWWSQRVREG